jgi:hypothetical protein
MAFILVEMILARRKARVRQTILRKVNPQLASNCLTQAKIAIE